MRHLRHTGFIASIRGLVSLELLYIFSITGVVLGGLAEFPDPPYYKNQNKMLQVVSTAHWERACVSDVEARPLKQYKYAYSEFFHARDIVSQSLVSAYWVCTNTDLQAWFESGGKTNPVRLWFSNGQEETNVLDVCGLDTNFWRYTTFWGTTNEALQLPVKGFSSESNAWASLSEILAAMEWTWEDLRESLAWGSLEGLSDFSPDYEAAFPSGTNYSGYYSEDLSSRCYTSWGAWTWPGWLTGKTLAGLPSAKVSYNPPEPSSVYAMRTYSGYSVDVVNACSETNWFVPYADSLSCDTNSGDVILATWDACDVDAPWESYELESVDVGYVPATVYLYYRMAHAYQIYSCGTNSYDAESIYWISVNTLASDCGFPYSTYTNSSGSSTTIYSYVILGQYDDVPPCPGDGSQAYATNVYYEDVFGNSLNCSNYFNADAPLSGTSIVSLCSALYGQATNTSYDTIDCANDDSLQAERDSRYLMYDFPHMATNFNFTYEQWVAGTNEAGYSWVEEAYLADSISTNWLTRYDGSNSTNLFTKTNDAILVVDDFVPGQSVLSQEPYYNFFTDEAKQWNIDRAHVLYKWDFDYGPE